MGAYRLPLLPNLVTVLYITF